MANFNDDEIIFFNYFYSLLIKENIDKNLISVNRLSDKILDVKYNDIQIGRIFLGKRASKMQVLTPKKVEWFKNESLDFYLMKITQWIKYIKKLKEGVKL